MSKEMEDMARELTRHLADHGKIIEGGWEAMKLKCMPAGAPEYQVQDMRIAFFMGAQHLLGSIMTFLEPGAELTDKDEARMNLIYDELKAFIEEMKKRPRE